MTRTIRNDIFDAFVMESRPGEAVCSRRGAQLTCCPISSIACEWFDQSTSISSGLENQGRQQFRDECYYETPPHQLAAAKAGEAAASAVHGRVQGDVSNDSGNPASNTCLEPEKAPPHHQVSQSTGQNTKVEQ